MRFLTTDSSRKYRPTIIQPSRDANDYESQDRKSDPNPKMDDIVINEALFAAFSKHLSASLNVVDVLYKIRQLGPDFDPNIDDPIMLAVFDPKMIVRLIELKYPEFVVACIKNFRMLEDCFDVFLSELDQNALELFVDALKYLTQTAWIENTEKGFVVHSPALIADLIISPIGRVHNEMLRSLDHFTKVLDAVGGDPTRLFLNAKSPTPESQYVQIWVSQKLGILARVTWALLESYDNT